MTKHGASFFVTTTLLLFFVFIVQSKTYASYFLSNLGWQKFASELVQSSNDIEPSIHYFLNAISVSHQNQRAYWGVGVGYERSQDESSAFDSWRAGQISPDLLNQYGVLINGNGRPNNALIYFRSAHKFEQSQPTQGYLNAGRVCQQHLPDFGGLSIENRRYCRDYFAANADILILDGQFDGEIDWSWTGSFSFSDPERATVKLDQVSGMPAPSLVFTGLTAGKHAGLYQRIPLHPGAKVRFGGDFRVESNESNGSLGAFLLYIGWRQNDSSQGNYLTVADFDTDWTHLEREFVLPGNSEPWIQVYPVLLIGQGQVWADNISIEILDE